MHRGKLIVIDGTDGSGKATQAALLVDNLRKLRKQVEIVDFPRYGQRSAFMVEEYLNGRLGTAKELGAYAPSVFFALDRFAASPEIKKYLSKGKIVISNRYVSANMGHQGAQVKNSKERTKYFRWVTDLEYNVFGLPRPDLTLILHMPAEVAQKLVDKKGHRNYVKGKKRDLLEADLEHLKAAERTYRQMSKMFRYRVIECYRNGKILSRKEIADLVWEEVRKFL